LKAFTVLSSVEFDVELLDPKHAPVMAGAAAGRAEAIVTGNRDLLADAGLLAWLRERGIDVLIPAELLRRREP
jgi:predicted nucleic acid-binding protein